MNNEDFKRLVEPLCMLTGYCRSASDLTKESDLRGWSARIMQLAERLDKAWEEVSRQGVQE